MSSPDFYFDLYVQQWVYITKVPPIVIDLTEDVCEIESTHNGTVLINITKEDCLNECKKSIESRPGEFLFMLIYF